MEGLFVAGANRNQCFVVLTPHQLAGENAAGSLKRGNRDIWILYRRVFFRQKEDIA